MMEPSAYVSDARVVWLGTGCLSAAVCAAVVATAPKMVTKLLQPVAQLQYSSHKDRASSGGRYSSFVHAVSVSALIFHILFATDIFDDSAASKNKTPVMTRTTVLTNIAMGISLGYFVLDAALVLKYMPAMGGPEMLTHHVAALLSVLSSTYHEECHLYTLILLATEVTTPFINIRWLLDKMGWKNTKFYLANGIALLLSWLFLRIGLCTWFFFHLYHRRDQIWLLHWPTAILVLTVPPMLFVLNLIWFSKIVKGVDKAIRMRGSQRQSGDTKDHATFCMSARGHAITRPSRLPQPAAFVLSLLHAYLPRAEQ